MAIERALFNVVQLANGNVLVGGGYQNGNLQTASVELYDPANALFRPAAELAVARGASAAVRLTDDSVAFIGGWSPSNAAWGSAEWVSPADLYPTALLNLPYSATIASSGTAPFTYTLKDGALPPGVLLDAQSGALSGTPTSAGAFRAVVQIADSTVPQRLTVRIVVIDVTVP
jgi:hypothetical protein